MNIREMILVIIALLTLVVCLAISGCTTISKGDFRYQSTIFDKKVDELTVNIDSNTGKVKMIEMKNYNSNADYVVEAVKAVAEVVK